MWVIPIVCETNTTAGLDMTPRLALLGWDVDPLTPRGQRVAHLDSALREGFEVRDQSPSRATGPREASADGGGAINGAKRWIGRKLVDKVMIDRTEPLAALRLRRWQPDVEMAVLVGFPFAPIAYAARCLAREGIPYVVDIGDPWALTGEGTTGSRFKKWRAARAERRMWEAASGAIVTTDLQADALRALFPHLKFLVRANGYDSGARVTSALSSDAERRTNSRELRIVHYGNLYGPRLDVEPFLESLASSDSWDRVVFRQHGDDWQGVLDRVERFIDVERRPPRAWSEVLAEAVQFDLALVIGNRNPGQLPSKAAQYLTLPIPRAALVTNDPRDALASYVRTKPAWATVRECQADAGSAIAKFLDRDWRAEDFEPPASEGWSAVEEDLARFVKEVSDTSKRPVGEGCP